jgi:hypothetical protein
MGNSDYREFEQYLVRIITFFWTGQDDQKPFDGWEHVVVVQGQGLMDALKRAIATSRSFFGKPDTIRMLGYRTDPMLHVAISIDYGPHIPKNLSCLHEQPLIINFLTFDDRQLEQLKSHEKVYVPIGAHYFEQ